MSPRPVQDLKIGPKALPHVGNKISSKIEAEYHTFPEAPNAAKQIRFTKPALTQIQMELQG